MKKVELLKMIIEAEQELEVIEQAMKYADERTLYGQALTLDYNTTLDTLYTLRDQYTHDVVGIEVPAHRPDNGAITVDRSEAIPVGGKSNTTPDQEFITQEELDRILEVPFERVMGYIGYIDPRD
jgi:hypothetical protein